MNQTGMTMSQISAAGAYARSERLTAESIPVRAIDPTRRRFQVDDQKAADQAAPETKAEAESTEADGQSTSSFTSTDGGGKASTGWGSGLLGAFTSFLTRMFAQSDTPSEATATAPTAQAGVQAYARAAANAALGNYNGPEVLSPNFPRLSSGRALDLTV